MFIMKHKIRLVYMLLFVLCFNFCASSGFKNTSESFESMKNIDLNHTSNYESSEKIEISFLYNLNNYKQNLGQFIQSLEFRFQCNGSKTMDNELENEHDRESYKPDTCTRIVYLLQNMDFNESIISLEQSQYKDERISNRSSLIFRLTINASAIFDDGYFDGYTTKESIKNLMTKSYTYPTPIVDKLSRELISSEFLVFTLFIVQDQLSTDTGDLHHLQSSIKKFEAEMKINFSYVSQGDWAEISNPKSMKNSIIARQLQTNITRDMFKVGDYKNDLSTDVISPFILGSTYDCTLRFKTNYWSDVAYIVKLKVENVLYTIEVQSFSSIQKSSGWKNHEIFLGKIKSPFQILMNLYVFPGILVIDKLSLDDCSDQNRNVRTSCSADEYQCRTGLCIQRDKVCNLVPDCVFGEDETDEQCATIPQNAKCSFDNRTCPMIAEFINCTAEIVDASSARLISDHTKVSDTGKIMSLSKENCDKGIIQTVTYDQPSIEIQRNKSCKLVLSHYLAFDGYTKLYIRVCQKYNCQKFRLRNNEKKVWETFNIPIFNISSRFYISILVVFTTGKLIHLDDIFLTKECFVKEEYNNMTTQLYSNKGPDYLDIIIIVGCAGVVITGFIVLVLVCRKSKGLKKFDINPYLLFRRPVVKDTFISPSKRAYLKIGLPQIPESSPLMKRLEDVMAETNLTYNAQNDLAVIHDIKNIPRHRLKIMSELGRGAFGEVYLGTMIQPGNNHTINVAVKKLRTLTSDEAKTDLLVEALTLSQFSHPNIVSCLGISIDNGTLMLVLELLEGGDLKKFLRSRRPSESSRSELHVVDLINLAIDIAKGCCYLQRNKFIHRDIAARNCLLTQAGPGRVAKIADFGLAREMLLSDYYRKRGHAKLPVRWMPPEAFFDGIFTHKSDVWAYGVLLWEIFSYALLPYPGMSNSEVMIHVHQGNRLSSPAGCPICISDVMGNCWNLLPEFRPTFGEIVEELTYMNKEFYRNTDEVESKIHMDDRQFNSYEYEEPQQNNP